MIGTRVLALFAVLACTACNAAEVSTGPAQSSTVVKIVPFAAVMRAGDTIRFAATATPAPATAAQWIWSSSVPTQVAVDSTGLARATATYPVGTICATLKSDVTAKGCADLVSPAR